MPAINPATVPINIVSLKVWYPLEQPMLLLL